LAIAPATNEQFLREVDDELRRDTALSIWKRWGRWIVALIVGGLLALAGVLFWQSRSTAGAGAESETLIGALDDVAADKDAGVKAKLDTLKASKSDGHRAAAKLTLAALAQKNNDLKGAAAQYAAIATDLSFSQPYRDLALIRQTAVEFDTIKPEAVVARLKPMAIAGNPWFGSAGEMVGIAYLRMNNRAEAGKIFGVLAADKTVPATIRSRAIQLAGTMGIDAIPAEPTNATAPEDKN
jgi:hypothetical protein